MSENELDSELLVDRIRDRERRLRRRTALMTLVPAAAAVALLAVASARIYKSYSLAANLADSRAEAIKNLSKTVDRLQSEKSQLQDAAQLCQSQYAGQSRVLRALQQSSRAHGVSPQILGDAERSVGEAKLVQESVARTLQRTPNTPIPRVFLQIAGENQRANARAVQDFLIAQGYNAPGIENVERAIRRIQLANTQVRYFHREDIAAAERLANMLQKRFGIRNAAPAFTKFEESPAHFEIWFSEDAFGVPDGKSGA